MRMTLCSMGVHDYVTKGSWCRCSRCWCKPLTEAKLAPARNRVGWGKKGPVR